MKFSKPSIFSLMILMAATQAYAESYELIIKRPQDAQTSLQSNFSESRSASEKFEVLKFSDPQDYEEAVQELSDLGVEWEPNYTFSADVISHGDVLSKSIEANLNDQDPFITEQWSLYNPSISSNFRFYGGDIDWLRARELSSGKGRLYIVDSGLDSENSEFAEKLIKSFDAVVTDGSGEDQNGHGTHVASIATASENSTGIVGVAPGSEVELVNVRMLGADNSGSTDDALRAYEFIEQDSQNYFAQNPQGFVVINNSWGGPNFSSSLFQAMEAASGERTLFVTSAGNDARNNDEEGYWPCNFNLPNNICVAASDTSDFMTSFSSFGKLSVDILAPGLHILGSVAGSSNYTDKSGTSQAAPHVAGAALMVWGANPSLNAAEVKDILLASVDRLPGAEGEVLSGGRLNIYRAILMATGKDPGLADRDFSSENSSGGGGCSVSMGKDSTPISLLWIVMMFCGLLIYRTRKN